MLQDEVLVGKVLGSVDTCTPRAVTVEEIAGLEHEVFDLKDSLPMIKSAFSLFPGIAPSWEMAMYRRKRKGGFYGGKNVSEVTYNAMETTSLIAQRTTLRVAGLTGAVLAEVLGGAGDDVGEELEFDTAERFT